MSQTMDPLPDKIPTEGVVALLIAALSATPLWRYLAKRRALAAEYERERAEHSQEIEVRKLTAEERKDHKLIRTLETQIKELRAEVKELRTRVDDNAQDKVTIATQAATITRLEADNARLRGRLRQLGEEVSEADETTPQAGSKPR